MDSPKSLKYDIDLFEYDIISDFTVIILYHQVYLVSSIFISKETVK